jgi:isopenicillin N synthase-like dioxygenase
MSRVPVVDLADFRGGDAASVSRFGERLRDALVDFGFVRVTGHGIEPDLVGRLYRSFEAFFALPESEKHRCAGETGGQRGFTPFGIEHAKDHPTPDLKEFYHVGRELPSDHPLAREYPDNIWPEFFWPDRFEGLQEDCIALYDTLDRCAAELLEALALGFALPGDTFSGMLSCGNSILRILHYPPHDALATGRAIRAAPHEDINLITLLCEASDSGLEILTREGEWIAVECGPGEIVADAGDMLSRVVNDVIPSTTHRVVTRQGGHTRHRYALPYFAHPYPDCDLSVIDTFVPAEGHARHAPITARDFLTERLKEIGLIPAD